MGNCHTVGPNEALVISGGCCGNQGKKYLVGGYGWAWCFVTEVQRISLEIMTLLPSVTNCESAKGNVLMNLLVIVDDEFRCPGHCDRCCTGQNND